MQNIYIYVYFYVKYSYSCVKCKVCPFLFFKGFATKSCVLCLLVWPEVSRHAAIGVQRPSVSLHCLSACHVTLKCHDIKVSWFISQWQPTLHRWACTLYTVFILCVQHALLVSVQVTWQCVASHPGHVLLSRVFKCLRVHEDDLCIFLWHLLCANYSGCPPRTTLKNVWQVSPLTNNTEVQNSPQTVGFQYDKWYLLKIQCNKSYRTD